MMAIKNCLECGKLCIENPSKLCPECYAQEEIHEHAVGEFLRETGKATIEEIHAATGVKEKIIVRMLKSGRLFSDGMIGYPCEMCRKPIYEGRLCGSCGSGLAEQVRKVNENRAFEERNEHQRTGLRMYTNDEIKK
ncbi:flagellar protein [Pelosinus sp. sgz500959]|uniref:flagellar protein n=1 Tax=Pelosinus sp. sgz500959 TaxID=3242472 RepID=UPI00366D63FD